MFGRSPNTPFGDMPEKTSVICMKMNFKLAPFGNAKANACGFLHPTKIGGKSDVPVQPLYAQRS